MGQRTILVDDLDGTESEVESYRLLSEDGRPLVIDLNKKNADKFRKALEPFWTAARLDEAAPAAPARAKATRKSSGSGRSDTAQIRAWARENNLTVPDRGRLKPDVIEAYEKAHPAA